MGTKHLLIMALIVALLPSNLFAQQAIKKSDGGLRLDNNMQYKNVTKWEEQTHSPELDDILNKAKALKESGQWGLKDDEIELSSGGKGAGISSQTVGQYSGLLRSIPQQYKSTYDKVSPTVQKRARESKFDVNSQYLNTDQYKKAIKSNLATQFDISSPGSIMTPQQWKAYVAHMKPSDKYSYNVGGTKKLMYQKDAVSHLIDACYSISAQYLKENGKTLNPDFLIALSINETGWGKNSLAQDFNSWFSVNATNVKTRENARKFTTTEAAVHDAIRLLYRYVDPNDTRFDKGMGPSIMGANTYYAQNDGSYSPNLNWTNTIVGVIEGCAKYNGVKIPTF